MKKLLTTLLLGSIFSACAERQPVPAIPSDPEIEGKIEKLLKGMTLEEKIGQMCELTIGVVTDKNNNKLSEALLDTVIGKYKVGSLLNIPFGVSQKKEVFAEVITQIQKKSLEEIGIPCILVWIKFTGLHIRKTLLIFLKVSIWRLLSTGNWSGVVRRLRLTRLALVVYRGHLLL